MNSTSLHVQCYSGRKLCFMTGQARLSQRAASRIAGEAWQWPKPSGAPYDPDLHPEGYINLSTAENGLIANQVIKLLSQSTITPQHLKYRTTLLTSSRLQLAELLPAYLSRSHPVRRITRENSVAGPGVGSLLAQLIWTLCDPGNGVLLSTPYYHDYARDIVHPAEAQPVFACVPPEVDSLSPAVLPVLRDRLRTSAEEGIVVKALILCNPHNPIPRCYPLETIEGYIEIAREFGLHLIADEIFANTTFPTADDPHPAPFISVSSLPAWDARSDMLQQIHILGGPTKDLGCSGLKAALLVTENQQVRQMVTLGLGATPISGIADAALTAVLQDESVVDELLSLNRLELSGAMDTCAEWAKFHHLPYIGANAGVYFILDLSPVAKKHGLNGPSGLAELMRMMIANGVHINPTAIDLDELPHRFRFIFTHQREILLLALRRLEEAFGLEPSRLTAGVNSYTAPRTMTEDVR